MNWTAHFNTLNEVYVIAGKLVKCHHKIVVENRNVKLFCCFAFRTEKTKSFFMFLSPSLHFIEHNDSEGEKTYFLYYLRSRGV